MDGEILAAAGTISQAAPRRAVTVLTDTYTGELLPGVAGVRVFAGHVALTNDLERKHRQLLMAGLVPDAEIGDSKEEMFRPALEELVRAVGPSFILLHRSAPALHLVAQRQGCVPLYVGQRWVAFACAR
ncbi:MAG: hypothetical protein HYZ28_20900 [Myxococcales bacterium]|nr:hypothetical protein [Myxococcales bacterium]